MMKFSVSFFNYVERTNCYFDIQNDKNSFTYGTIKVSKFIEIKEKYMNL